jgi:N-methylhydantoinase A/oxoprolinase/acetone carboxylase beta subunit
MGIRNLLESVYDDLKGRIFINIAKLLIEDEDKSLISEGMNHQLKEVLLNGFRKAPDIGNGTKMAHSFMNSFKTEYSLVGIGAPIHVFLPDVARAMETRCMIPEHAAVANAAGAITANIRAEKKARVVPEYTASGISGYGVFSEKGVGNFKTYQKALDAALKAASSDAVEAAKARGAGDASVKTDVFENKAEVPIVFADGFRPEEENRDTQETDSFLVETVVTAVAVGRPAWDKGFSFKTIQQQAC